MVGVLSGIPATIIDDSSGKGDLSTSASVVVRVATVIGFLVVPVGIAIRWGAPSLGAALRRLGVRRFGPMAIVWMLTAVAVYTIFAVVYATIFGVPEQDEIAERLGPLALQVLLVGVLVGVSEELCFRGMLFAGLRERLPRYAAALTSAAIFGVLHASSGLGAVPVIIAIGCILALLYERTGSIVPGILLHMLNNSTAILA
jgi:membrane protease YdiL (CAAX protease family)